MKRLKSLVVNPLAIMVLLIAVIYIGTAALHLAEESRTLDRIVLYFVGVVSFLSFLFIVIRTQWRDWTTLGAGLMGHFLAVAIVYVYLAYSEPFAGYEFVLLFARSTLVISGVFVLIGMVREWWIDLNCDWRCLWDRLNHLRRSVKVWRHKRR